MPTCLLLILSLFIYLIVLYNTVDYVNDVTVNFIIFYFLGYFAIMFVVIVLTFRMAFKSIKRI